ncbi:MAG: threonine synthase [Acidobacteriaceae bacterium]|nr:threonine synthase [Acidobacteriaceae bacterium]
MSTLIGLQCHLCQAVFPAEATYVCSKCLGPLEPIYDYDLVKKMLTKDVIASRAKNLWRYRELLPITGEPQTGFHSGFTPLVRCTRLAERLGIRELYIKDDSVNHPTLSYKDRVVSVAATRAKEFGCRVLACASTGNLANSVSAHAARLGMECCVFIPDNLEAGKVLGSAIFGPTILAIAGNYDDVNRLCTQVADRYGWGFVNINLRSYYAEGAKTLAFEVAEQLGWRFPTHLVSPVAGGTLLPRIARGFREFKQIGLVDGELPHIHAAQAAGCAPVVNALNAGEDYPDPVKPDTIAKSIAIGNPADGYQVIQTVRATGGSGTAVGDDEIVDAIRVLAETEGIFTEPAGGTTLAGTIDLVRRGVIKPDDSAVVCITGNGYKTAEVVANKLNEPVRLSRAFKEFEAWQESRRALA